MMSPVSRIARIAAFAIAFCFVMPVAAESAMAAPARLTVAQAREAQALFGFDETIPRIIEEALKEQPEYRAMTPVQRECLLGMASPAFYGLFDDAFIEMFGDTAVLADWKAFSATSGGSVFIDSMRSVMRFKINGGTEPDMAGILGALSDAEKAEIVAFMGSPAAQVIQKGFPDVRFPPELEKTLQARAEQECGVTLDKL